MSRANLDLFEADLSASLSNLQRILNFYLLKNLASNELFLLILFFYSFYFTYLTLFQCFILHITLSDSFLLVKKWLFFAHRFNDFTRCKDFWWIIIKLEINHFLTYILHWNKYTNNPKWLNLSVKVILVWLPLNMFYNIK